MTHLEKYEEWISTLEQGQAPAELAHIAVSVSGKARHLAGEILSFSWPTSQREQAEALAYRARAIGKKNEEEDLQAYLAREPA